MTDPITRALSRPIGKMFAIIVILATPVMLFLLWRETREFRKLNELAVINRIETILGGGDASQIVSDNILADPFLGSLILAFVVGMTISLAMKTDVPIPVWLITFIVVVIVFTIGMTTWAIPISIVYISEAFAAGQAVSVGIIIFLIFVGSAFIFGIGLGYYIAFGAEAIKRGFGAKGEKHSRRKTASVKIRTRRGR